MNFGLQGPVVAGVSFSSYPVIRDRELWREGCQRLMNDGILTHERILERFTRQILRRSGEQSQLKRKFHDLWRIENPEAPWPPPTPAFLGCFLAGEPYRWYHAGDPQISKTRFCTALCAPFEQYSPILQKGLNVLYKVFAHYSQFPFPIFDGWSVSEGACYRGINLLAGLYEWASVPGTSGPTECGPYQGYALTYRAFMRFDERRRMFRFLATPIPVDLRDRAAEPGDRQVLRLPVPQFTYDVSSPSNVGEGAVEGIPPQTQVIIQDNEDEREVDLIDVLLELYGRNQDAGTSLAATASSTKGPFRDSFRDVLPTLPEFDKSLHELRILYVHWRAFVGLLLVSSFGVYLTHLNAMFEERGKPLSQVLDAMCLAFVTDHGNVVRWDAFNAVIRRSMPALFRNPPHDGLTNLLRPFLQPESQLVQNTRIIESQAGAILIYPRLAQLRTFVDPFSRCKLFFGSSRRLVHTNTVEEFRLWEGDRYILISGYENGTHIVDGQIQTFLRRVVVGMTIRAGHFTGPLSTESSPQEEEKPQCSMQVFQLCPEHRVYGFTTGQLTLDPMMSVKIGVTDDNWLGATEPTGHTRIAFMEDMNQCVFEHGISRLQDESQQWLPYGRGQPGVKRIAVDGWEVWGFDN